jgi:ankyrin repeat protein
LVASSHHEVGQYTEVVAAADACNLPAVEQAVNGDHHLVTATEWDHATLLHDAVGHDCADVAAFLVQAGADPNARKSDGVTPLHMAAQRGDDQVITLLLDHGACINAVDAKGWTPLDRAAKWGHPESASLLHDRGGRAGGSEATDKAC